MAFVCYGCVPMVPIFLCVYMNVYCACVCDIWCLCVNKFYREWMKHPYTTIEVFNCNISFDCPWIFTCHRFYIVCAVWFFSPLSLFCLFFSWPPFLHSIQFIQEYTPKLYRRSFSGFACCTQIKFLPKKYILSQTHNAS